MTIVSHGWAGPGRFEDRTATFGPLVRALSERLADIAPAARISVAGADAHAGLSWAIGLLGVGAAALLVFSLTAGTAALGVSLAARLLFALILIFAVTPWLVKPATALDPRNLPRSLAP